MLDAHSALEQYTSLVDRLQPSFYFGVSMAPLMIDAAFQSVSGLKKEIEIEEVKSGGENRFHYRLPKGGKFENLKLERGVALKGAPLSIWCETFFSSDFAYPVFPMDLLVTLYNPDHLPTMVWHFVKAYPVRWSMSDLKSQENQILIETIELSYRYFAVL